MEPGAIGSVLRYAVWGPSMSKRDALADRDAFQRQAEAYAEAGFTMRAIVLAVAADMCQAAWWSSEYGAGEAYRRVSDQYPDSSFGPRSGFLPKPRKRGDESTNGR